jgi:hypothetical protein
VPVRVRRCPLVAIRSPEWGFFVSIDFDEFIDPHPSLLPSGERGQETTFSDLVLSTDHMHLILYSKVGCHLCEGLEQKLRSILTSADRLEIREITSNPDWWNAYQYEIPVLYMVKGEEENILPRLSPRAPVTQLQEMLQRYL